METPGSGVPPLVTVPLTTHGAGSGLVCAPRSAPAPTTAISSELASVFPIGLTGMADLITDEMLDTYAVTGSYATIAARLTERYAGLLDRTAFYQPYKQPGLDDPRLPRVIQDFNR